MWGPGTARRRPAGGRVCVDDWVVGDWLHATCLHMVQHIVLSFASWLVVGVHRQSCRSSILDPLNVTPRTHLVRIPCAVNAKCDTRSPIIVSCRPPRLANRQWIPTTNPVVNDSTAQRAGELCLCSRQPPSPPPGTRNNPYISTSDTEVMQAPLKQH
jgi:hypothetical protein